MLNNTTLAAFTDELQKIASEEQPKPSYSLRLSPHGLVGGVAGGLLGIGAGALGHKYLKHAPSLGDMLAGGAAVGSAVGGTAGNIYDRYRTDPESFKDTNSIWAKRRAAADAQKTAESADLLEKMAQAELAYRRGQISEMEKEAILGALYKGFKAGRSSGIGGLRGAKNVLQTARQGAREGAETGIGRMRGAQAATRNAGGLPQASGPSVLPRSAPKAPIQAAPKADPTARRAAASERAQRVAKLRKQQAKAKSPVNVGIGAGALGLAGGAGGMAYMNSQDQQYG